MRAIGADAGGFLVAVATAIVLVALAVAAFLTPAWVSFEQDRAHADAWTGWTPEQVHAITAAVLHDLVIGPPNFAEVDPNGAAVFTERERSHLRDVRAVFSDAALIALLAVVVVVAGALTAIRDREGARRRAILRAARAGAAGLGVAVVALGVVAIVAFDAAFELFHRLFFASGSYTFDPRTDRLVQLFPDAFWSETTIVLGGVLFVAAVAVVLLTMRGLRRLGQASDPAARPVARPIADPFGRESRP